MNGMMNGLLQQMFGTTDGVQILIMMLTRVFIVLTILPVHEFAHAWAAKKLGDDTAEKMGRLSLNPFVHLDKLGSAMLILLGFGFAKPVPVNPARFTNQKKRRVGMALTAAAGPLSNIVMALISVVLFCAVSCISNSSYFYLLSQDSNSIFNLLYFNEFPKADVWSFLGFFLVQFANINICLAVFNLLPVPPLDGSRIIGLLFPEKWMYAIERYSFVIIIVLFVAINRVAAVGNAFGSLTSQLFFWLHNGIAWIFGLFGAQLLMF